MTWKGADPHPLFLPNEDTSSVNLEHVLPRRPDGNWPQFPYEEAENYHRRLGNMALINSKLNSTIKSSSFADKKAALTGSPAYELTAQITTLPEWTPSVISERKKKMAEVAVKTWPFLAS